MAWPDDLRDEMANDYLVWNDTETVLYISKTAEVPQPTGVDVSGTLWLILSKDMAPADGPLIGMHRTVEIPGAVLAGLDTPIVPKANDIMQRCDGTRWTIKKVEQPAGVDWRVDVVKGNK